MPQKYSRERCKANSTISFSPDFEALGRAGGRMLLVAACSCLNRQCLKERKEMELFSKFGLFPPFDPCCRLLFKDSFSPSDISVSEFSSHQKHDMCFLFNMLFKVTVNFLNFHHFPLVASAGKHRTNFSRCSFQKEARRPVAGCDACLWGLHALVEHLTPVCKLLCFWGQGVPEPGEEQSVIQWPAC